MRIKHRVGFISTLFLLFSFSFTTFAQELPMPDTPVIRTAEDIEAIKKLDAEVMARQPKDLREEQTSHFEIPMTIKVGITPYLHCSEWVQEDMPITEVIEMDFKEYVKNVLPNEWINSWHPQSLMTGAVAAKSFAWWRITLNNPRPEGVDVVNNTCDQVFIRNSRKPTTDAAVDATWHYRMSRNNRISEIHYLAHDWQCEQKGWEMCMGQWGSQEKALAGWQWQDILKFYYEPMDINVTNTIPPNQNLVLNGGFDQGTERWLQWGGIDGTGVVDGMLQFHRKVDSANIAAVYQDFNYRVPEDTPMRVSLMLGNSSAVPKTVEVHLRKANSWVGAISCTFTLLPNLPMQKYTVYGTNPAGWVGVRLEIQGLTADDQPAYRVDNVKVMFKSKGKPADVEACDAPKPGRPTLKAPVAQSTQGKNVLVSLTPGESNLRPEYSPAYHVQVSRTADFATTVYDNRETLSSSPEVTARVVPDGMYYVRARQFDGIDRFSRWSKPVLFNVIVLPDTPILVAPVNEASGEVFLWEHADDATLYKLSLRDSAGNKLGNTTFTTSICSADVCAISSSALPVTLTTGQRYQWRLIARNANGKAKSAWQPFTVTIATALPSITPVSENPTADPTVEETSSLFPLP